jgi:hypothetical protein
MNNRVQRNNFRRNYGRNRKAKTHDGGTRFGVPAHPPGFTAVPWYNLVVRVVDPPASVLTTTLQAAISTQLGISFIGSLVNVRLQSVRVWSALSALTSSSPLVPLSVTVLDPIAGSFQTTSTARVLESLIDYPDAVRRAAVGYKYPKAQREVSLVVSNANPVVLLNLLGGGAGAVVYFSLQWRPGTTAVSPAIEDEFENIPEDDVVSIRNIRDTLVRDEDGKIISLAEKFSRLGYK